MRIPPVIVGCDVSKAKIDLFDAATGHHLVIANEPTALDLALEAYSGSGARFAYEATGFYGDALRAALARHGLAGISVNPLQGRRFAEAQGRLAKTDRIDAAGLAEMAARFELAETAPWEDATEALKSLISRRDQLVGMRAAERKRIGQTAHPVALESLARVVDALSTEIATLEAEIEAASAADPDIARRRALLSTIPGLGPATTAVLAAMLPEAGTTDRGAIAALAGVAPMARDSGTFTGRRSIAGGRGRVRRALYQAALSATRGRSRLATKYRQLRQAGKPAKVAIIAIARKIVVIANAVLKTGKAYA